MGMHAVGSGGTLTKCIQNLLLYLDTVQLLNSSGLISCSKQKTATRLEGLGPFFLFFFIIQHVAKKLQQEIWTQIPMASQIFCSQALSAERLEPHPHMYFTKVLSGV